MMWLLSCAPYTIYQQNPYFNPFDAGKRIADSRACEKDSLKYFQSRYDEVYRNLKSNSNLLEITGKPNDIYSRLAEYALIASDVRGKCGSCPFPLIVKSNKPIDSLWFFGTNIFLAKDNSYLKSFKKCGFSRHHITIKMHKYNFGDAFTSLYFAPHMSTEPHYVVDVDRFYKFNCGEERRKYRFYMTEGPDGFNIESCVTIDEHNICCRERPIELQDTSITNAEWNNLKKKE
jgi:hypothetical protein